MIEVFSLATAHLFDNALASQARLRYRVFVQGRGLAHLHFDGLEYDEFDTPAAVYLVWRDRERIVRGVARLLRTTRPYMLQSYWPDLVESGPLPSSPDVWEVTRVCVDKGFDPQTRLRIFPELLCAMQEFAYLSGLRGVIGVTRQHMLEHFLRSGIQWLGPAAMIEGEMERAFYVPREHLRPARHCAKYALPASVMRLPDAEKQKLAA